MGPWLWHPHTITILFSHATLDLRVDLAVGRARRRLRAEGRGECGRLELERGDGLVELEQRVVEERGDLALFVRLDSRLAQLSRRQLPAARRRARGDASEN